MTRMFDPTRRAVEGVGRKLTATKLVKELASEVERIEPRDPKSAQFIEDIAGRLAVDPEAFVTDKQLLWLQNLHDRWCG